MVARTQPGPGPRTSPARLPTVIMMYGDRLLRSTLLLGRTPARSRPPDQDPNTPHISCGEGWK